MLSVGGRGGGGGGVGAGVGVSVCVVPGGTGCRRQVVSHLTFSGGEQVTARCLSERGRAVAGKGQQPSKASVKDPPETTAIDFREYGSVETW